MRTPILAAVAAVLALSAPASSAPPPRAAAAKVDWTRSIVDTGRGWRMGKPAAPTKLVEYGSFNCPHCAAFAKGAMPAIRKLVAAGRISFEFRPKQLFPHDPSATLLARCAGKDHVFAFTEDYMANQQPVLAKLRAAYKADPAFLDKAGESGKANLTRTIARVGEMGPIAQRHGVSAARANACLGDPAMIAKVEADEQAAVAAGVNGTPTFFINGKLADPAALKALGIPVDL